MNSCDAEYVIGQGIVDGVRKCTDCAKLLADGCDYANDCIRGSGWVSQEFCKGCMWRYTKEMGGRKGCKSPVRCEWGTEYRSEEVNMPKHYTAGKYETIDVIEDTLTPEEFRGFLKGNIIKYTLRERHKGGIVDLQKVEWYIKRLVGTHERKAQSKD